MTSRPGSTSRPDAGTVPGTDTDGRLPVRMPHDRILVRAEADSERRSGSGSVVPATAAMGRRLGWAEVPDGGTGPYL